jgi:hypothetical protein
MSLGQPHAMSFVGSEQLQSDSHPTWEVKRRVRGGWCRGGSWEGEVLAASESEVSSWCHFEAWAWACMSLSPP